MPGDKLPDQAVLDASVAVRLLVPEVGSDEASQLFEQSFSWVAPRLLVTEVASALRRKVVGGGIGREFALQAMQALRSIVDEGALRFIADESLASDALLLALSMDHKFPDCLYLALAEREGAVLATADRALANLAKRRKVDVHVVAAA